MDMGGSLVAVTAKGSLVLTRDSRSHGALAPASAPTQSGRMSEHQIPRSRNLALHHPAIALQLQATLPAGRVAELGSLAVTCAL